MDGLEKNNKSNIIVDFFKVWLYLFLYAFKGIKFVLLDMWVLLFSSLQTSSKKDTATQKSNEDPSAIYELTKAKAKAKKTYKYSAKKLAKYEKMKIECLKDLQTSGATRSRTPNIYQFIVRDVKGDGKIFTDTMSGFSKLDINSFLVNEGYEVYSIKTNKYINFLYKDSSFSTNMSVNDLVFWLTQLSTYIKAGITLKEAVEILAMQMKKKKRLSKVLKAISYELSLGQTFSSALEKQGNYFPALLINMIKAAEATGTIQETLEDMASYYNEVNNTRKEMKSALTYPAIITVFAISVCTFIIVYVVPQFTKIYAQSDIEVTGITKIVVTLSDFLSQNLVTVIGVIVLIGVLLYFAYKKIKAFKITCQIIFMKLPVIKNVIIYKELSIFSKTFASLLRNNVFITESMDILTKITSNEIYKAIMYKTINNIVRGDKISEAFADHWAVPDVAYYMIVTGESTGQLAEMMQKVSEYYQIMHKNIVSALKSLIEPIMIVFLALIVGVIILAVIVPMFQLYNNIL